MATDQLEFYSSAGRMTDLAPIADHLVDLPADIGPLCGFVQGLILHPFWAHAYGVTGVEERDDELQLRSAAGILQRATQIDSAPLGQSREPDRRVLGNCRDFSTVTCALLRHQGIPARARCGFATYFEPGRYVDHWVVEWWDGSKWRMTDAQLDQLQLDAVEADFDPLDVPRHRFIDAGRAWGLCRAGEADSQRFGILDMWGSWFIRGNVVRDLAALNKVELLPWDAWGIADLESPPPDEDVDPLAEIATAADFGDVVRLYESDDRIKVPDVITSHKPAGSVRVKL